MSVTSLGETHCLLSMKYQARSFDTEIGSSFSGGGLYSFSMIFSWQGVLAGPSRCSGNGQVKDCAQLQSQRARNSISRK